MPYSNMALRNQRRVRSTIKRFGTPTLVHTPQQSGVSVRADRTYNCLNWPKDPDESSELSIEGAENVGEPQPYVFKYDACCQIYEGDILSPQIANAPVKMKSWQVLTAEPLILGTEILFYNVVGVRV